MYVHLAGVPKVLNHFQLRSSADWFNFTKVMRFKWKTVLPFQFVLYQMKIIKRTLQNTLFAGQVISISIFVRICLLCSVYSENTEISCVCPRQNSNLSKSPYTDVSNGKANISSDSCFCNKSNQNRIISSHAGLFRTFNSIILHGLIPSFIQRRRRGWYAIVLSNGSAVIVTHSKFTIPLYWHM